MVIELTSQTIIAAAGLATALGVLIGLLVKFVRWVDRQQEQDRKIAHLEEKHDADLKSMREETQLLMFGILSCLKGLQEKGCNSRAVAEAANMLEKYLNEKAHDK